MAAVLTRKGKAVQNPPVLEFLFNNKIAAWLWLPLRIWLGWQWITAAEHKISDPGWVVTGEALKGFWMKAVAIPAAPAKPAIAFDWFRSFLQMMLNAQAYTWFGKVIAYGEVLVGIGLIIGAFVGIAAFFGAVMNWNFMMAGSASTNPMLFVIAILLVLAWKVAGYIGADFFLLKWLGTPWKAKEEAVIDTGPAVKNPA